jgi:hypothetical protein
VHELQVDHEQRPALQACGHVTAATGGCTAGTANALQSRAFWLARVG